MAGNPWATYVLARARALRGQHDQAAELLRRARQLGYDQPYFILIDPAFRLMQDHPVTAEIAPESRQVPASN